MNYAWFNLNDIPDELLVKIVKESEKFYGDSLGISSVTREILSNTHKENRGKLICIDHVFSKALRVAALRYCEKNTGELLMTSYSNF